MRDHPFGVEVVTIGRLMGQRCHTVSYALHYLVQKERVPAVSRVPLSS